MSQKTPRNVLEGAAMHDHETYNKTFQAADMDNIGKYCTSPVAYVGEDYVRLSEKYPFDLKKLQAKTGMSAAETKDTIIAIDENKCHLLIEGRRLKADGSLAQHNSAFYYLLKQDGVWKTACFSGVLTDAKDVTPEQDEAMKAKVAGRPYTEPPKSARRLELEAEAMKDHKDYLRAFNKGDMEAMKKEITNPIAYLGDDFLKVGPNYPFDLGKLMKRISAGGAAPKAGGTAAPAVEKPKPTIPAGGVKETILAIDENKCHLLIEGRRCGKDGSLTEQNRAFYILLKDKKDGHWKTACFSGVLTKAADVTQEEDKAFYDYITDKSQVPPQPRAKL